MDETYDVVVIGGGAAGLSGAVALARFRRSVLVLDAADPRNERAAHVHNFLSRDGAAPSDLYAVGREEVLAYGGQVEQIRVLAVRRDGRHFAVETEARTVMARRLLIATGGRDELPEIPGLAERWGLDVLHCPYCHGWEVRDQRIGVLATGPLATHQALLFRQLSPHITLLQHIGSPLTSEQREQLAALGVTVQEGAVVQVESDANRLTGVRLADGSTVELDALVVASTLRARAELLSPLGLEPVEVAIDGHVIGTVVEADPVGATAAPGIWIAGNLANLQAQVVSSAAAGLGAGAAINADLIAEEAKAALEHHRHGHIHGQDAWEERYRSVPQNWSGNPNAVLVTEVADLTPGTALEAGCGEGGDALWLATQGWSVTGADFSATALARAEAEADRVGLSVQWRQLDLVQQPAPGAYDLVTGFFLHQPAEPRRRLFGHLADAVAPGGTLLIVGHDLSDAAVLPRPHLADMGWTNAEVIAALGVGWTVLVDEARPRRATLPDGREVEIHDAVLRARRDPA